MSLILTRRANEAIHIGRDIIVKIIGVKDDQVSLSFTAPDDVLILRDELVERQADDDYAVRVK